MTDEVALVFDQMLPRSLVRHLSGDFDILVHVERWQMDATPDATIWERAKAEGCTIVTRDSDFQDLLVRFGSPPKVVWLRLGNCGVGELISTLKHHAASIVELHRSNERCLIIDDIVPPLRTVT